MSGEEHKTQSHDDQTNPQASEQESAESIVSDVHEAEESIDVPENADFLDVQNQIDSLQSKLEFADKKAADNWDQVLRIKAEMENLRRRTRLDVENAHKFALEKFVRDLIPVVDSLELGNKAATGDSEQVVKFREGGELTLKQFVSVLEKFQCVQIDPLGEMFNPDFHQAMAMQPSANAEPNSVIEVFQKGYLLNDRLVRPALVIVAQATDAVKIDEQA